MDYTIKQIAQMAGVSKSTVSRVISGNGYTSPEVRGKVLQIIDQLQYKPNAVARAMVSQRTNNIGVIIYRRDYPIVSHPFYGKILDAIIKTAAGLHYSIIVTTDYDLSVRAADFMLEKRVDGLILLSRFHQNVIDYIKHFDVPYLMVNGSTDVEGVIHVVNQDEAGGQQAAAYLNGLGHGRIFVIAGPQTHRSHYLRLRGFSQQREALGLQHDSQAIVYAAASTFDEGYRMMKDNWRQFAAEPYSALFATNDTLALGAMKFLTEQSVRIPGDISVMGFDDIDLAAMFIPSLTTVAVEKEEIGTQAMIVLDKLIRQEPVTQQAIQFEPKLLARQSTSSI